MENRLPSTEKKVHELRATSTIFVDLQRLYRTSVEFSVKARKRIWGNPFPMLSRTI